MLIYPPQKHSTSSSSIFFIGSAQDFCRINGKDIELINGNFAPIFKLEAQLNRFSIDIDGETQELEITRTEQEQQSLSEFKQYSGTKLSQVIQKICLDPGHGGSQAGTCSPKGIKEKDLNLSLAKKLADKLTEAGFEVILTRTEDQDLGLKERVDIARDFNSDLFLSIHHNAIPDHLDPAQEQGISAHYYYNHSQGLAAQLTEYLSVKLEMNNKSAIQQDLHVTRENDFCQAILLECGYLIHPVESERISSKEFQEQISQEICQFFTQINAKNF